MTLALVSDPGVPVPILRSTPLPQLGPTDLRVRVRAASVDLVDTLVVAGVARAIFGLTGTVGLGFSVTGTVTAVGTDVVDVAVGDEIAALHPDIAAPVRAAAEETIVPAATAARLPDGIDPVAAASLPLNGSLAAVLVERLGPADGRTLLVTGAAGSVGGYAVALAARAGWAVTGLARPGDRDFVLRAGARELVTELPGPRFDAVLDGAVLHGPALAALRDGGIFVAPPAAVLAAPERGIDVRIESVRTDSARLARLLRLAAAGVLELRVAGRVPLAEAESAYKQVSAGGQRGRWLLEP
ncbi:zinc-binding dehydrogenase [Pseudonocardia sp. CA-107938]|uniref:zinc-binding dehydrogenase n=1 Tax=Pseudonocardia sp. CA-107938 TaxID=3240021 RepID=UPI003D8AAA9D